MCYAHVQSLHLLPAPAGPRGIPAAPLGTPSPPALTALPSPLMAFAMPLHSSTRAATSMEPQGEVDQAAKATSTEAAMSHTDRRCPSSSCGAGSREWVGFSSEVLLVGLLLSTEALTTTDLGMYLSPPYGHASPHRNASPRWVKACKAGSHPSGPSRRQPAHHAAGEGGGVGDGDLEQILLLPQRLRPRQEPAHRAGGGGGGLERRRGPLLAGVVTSGGGCRTGSCCCCSGSAGGRCRPAAQAVQQGVRGADLRFLHVWGNRVGQAHGRSRGQAAQPPDVY